MYFLLQFTLSSSKINFSSTMRIHGTCHIPPETTLCILYIHGCYLHVHFPSCPNTFINLSVQNPWMDSISHATSDGMWHITWILMIEEKLIFEDDNVNWRRNYMSALMLKGSDIKGINTSHYTLFLNTQKFIN